MNTLSITSTKTMSYDADASVQAFAIVECVSYALLLIFMFRKYILDDRGNANYLALRVVAYFHGMICIAFGVMILDIFRAMKWTTKFALVTLVGPPGALIAHHRMEYRFFTLAKKLFRDEALELLAAVGMAEDADRVAGTLAYGRQKQLELAVGLASEPNFLLLDEPTAGMSGKETRQAIDIIARITGERKLTLLFTEHDMEVVFGIADRISVLYFGKILL